MIHRRFSGRIARLFQRLCRPNGNTAITFALAFIPMVGFLGLSIDGGRAYMVKSQLGSATDIAAISGARLFTDNQRNARAKQFFDTNFVADDHGVVLKAFTLTATATGSTKTVNVKSKVEMPTLFMSMFGASKVTLTAEATAQRVDSPIEMVLALDNTGSMALNTGSGTSRIDALKTAVNTMVDAMYGSNPNNTNIRMGIVPYTAYVNVGRLLPSAYVDTIPGYTDRPITDPLGWKGCVDADPTNTSIDGSTNLNSGQWNSARDTLDMKPGWTVRPSLFPAEQGAYDEYVPASSDAGETCSGFVPQTITTTDNNPTITDTYCVEANCYSTTKPNPNFGKTSTRTTGCTPRPPSVTPAYTKTTYIASHKYDVGGATSVYVRSGSYPAGYNWNGGNGNLSNYRYLPQDPSWLPPLPYASRTTNRSGSFANLIAPTADNFDDPGDVIAGTGSDSYASASPNTYCPEQALPLANYPQQSVKAYVNANLKPFFPDWGTFSNLGLLWSWRMLSPSEPFAGSAASTGYTKAVVLMTDGELWHPGGYDRGINVHDVIRTAYGFGSEGRLVNNPNATNAELVEAIRQRLRKTCANLKKDGVTVYTVTFDPAMSASEKDVYRKCATLPTLYYDAPSAQALTDAFKAIADDVAGVRLTK